MYSSFPQKPKEFIKNLEDFDRTQKSLHLDASAKNIGILENLQIENLWLVSGNEAQFKTILPLVRPKFLNLYNLQVKDLSLLEGQTNASTIIIHWNT